MRTTALFAGALAVLATLGAARAQTLLSDDFDDNVLDPTKWSVVTYRGEPQPNSETTRSR